MYILFFVLVAVGAPMILCITNDPQLRRDSYMSAYLDLHHGSTEPPAGIVYAEPVRAYGPPQPQPQPQPKPIVYYGPPAPSHFGGVPPSAIPIDHHAYAQDYTYAPVVDILTKLPEKLEFLPKLVAAFLGITKILLKVVLLKMILKFIVMFCLFFFLPKLEMLDLSTDGEPANTSPAASNNTGPHTPVEDLEEGRLNSITKFVLDSVESRRFLKKYCGDSRKSAVRCKMMKTFVELEEYATTSRLFKLFETRSSATKIP